MDLITPNDTENQVLFAAPLSPLQTLTGRLNKKILERGMNQQQPLRLSQVALTTVGVLPPGHLYTHRFEGRRYVAASADGIGPRVVKAQTLHGHK